MNIRFLLFVFVILTAQLHLIHPPLIFATTTHAVSNLLELQNALDTAASNNDADIINITATTIDVTAELTFDVTNSENFPLTINGAGSLDTILDGGGRDIGLLAISFTEWPLVDDNVIITLSGITFQNANSSSSPVYIDLNYSTIIIEDCTITNNTVNDYTAGLYVYTGGDITVSSCNISGNSNNYGGSGGAYLESYGSVEIANSIFNNNQVTAYGDGAGLAIYSDTATLTGNTITNNTLVNYEDSGGAGAYISTDNAIVVDDNHFQNNTITENGYGGAAYIDSRLADVSISNNRVIGNRSGDQGGGFYIDAINAEISSNQIYNNSTELSGGGISLFIEGTVKIYNNIIAGNTTSYNDTSCSYGGAGLFLSGYDSNSFLLTNNTVAENTTTSCGGGLSAYYLDDSNSLALRNNISWGNSASGFGSDLYINGDAYNNGGGATMNIYNNDYPLDGLYILGADNTTYFGNIHSTPMFVETSTNDYHLGPGSPCKDQGANTYVTEIATDFEGDERIVNSYVDIGADEYLINPDKGDVNNDQVVDLEDAILSLQIVTGRMPAETIFKEADVDDDGKLGIDDVIYILNETVSNPP